jgi:hypothetical protein
MRRFLALFLLTSLIALAQTTALMPTPKFQGLDNTGAPLNGGRVYTYAAGTSSPQVTYSDSAGTSPNTNPVILDAGGRAVIRLGPLSYKITLTDRLGSQIWSIDNVSGMVPCPTCLTTAGSQTITGPDTFSGGLTTTALTSTGGISLTANIACSASGACGNIGGSANPFASVYLTNLDALAEIKPHFNNGASLGDTSYRFSKLWTTDVDMNGTFTFSALGSTGPQCLQVDASGVVSGVGASCTAGMGSLYLALAGGTMAGNILGDGTATIVSNASVSLGGATHYLQDGLFGGVVQAKQLWVINGTPNTPSDFFYWENTGVHLLTLKNSSSTAIVAVDDAHYLGNPTMFYFMGNLAPNATNSYSIGNTGSRWLKTWTQDLDISGTLTAPNGNPGLSTTITVQNSAGSGTCTITFSAGIMTASTC